MLFLDLSTNYLTPERVNYLLFSYCRHNCSDMAKCMVQVAVDVGKQVAAAGRPSVRLAFTLLARMSAWLPHQPYVHHSCPAILQGARLHSTPRRKTVPCAAVTTPDAAPRKANLTKYKMTELRKMLCIRGLSPNGKKVDLVKRLTAHLAERGALQRRRKLHQLTCCTACLLCHPPVRKPRLCFTTTALVCALQVMRWDPQSYQGRRLHQVLLPTLSATSSLTQHRSGICRLREQRSWRRQLRRRGRRLVQGQGGPGRLPRQALPLFEPRLRRAGVLWCRGAQDGLS